MCTEGKDELYRSVSLDEQQQQLVFREGVLLGMRRKEDYVREKNGRGGKK
jgi:hypothetical protein